MRSRKYPSALTVVTENVSTPDKQFFLGSHLWCLSLLYPMHVRAGSDVSHLITVEEFVTRHLDEPCLGYQRNVLKDVKVVLLVRPRW